MPTSYPQQISTLIQFIMYLNPRSVLDIGVGFGKYGLLCREYLEVWNGSAGYNQFSRRIDGIEAFPRYLTPVHDYVYNNVYHGDALELVDGLDHVYDLVIMVDVLEHFTADDGASLIRKIMDRHRGILVSTPKEVDAQGGVFENSFETHRSAWSRRDLTGLGPALVIPNQLNWIVYLGSEAEITPRLRTWRTDRLRAWIATRPRLASTLRAARRLLPAT
jgi:SAM-dependent methyltransferase